jgi:hypothetical protein
MLNKKKKHNLLEKVVGNAPFKQIFKNWRKIK